MPCPDLRGVAHAQRRTPNTVKNHWNSSLYRVVRQLHEERIPPAEWTGNDFRQVYRKSALQTRVRARVIEHVATDGGAPASEVQHDGTRSPSPANADADASSTGVVREKPSSGGAEGKAPVRLSPAESVWANRGSDDFGRIDLVADAALGLLSEECRPLDIVQFMDPAGSSPRRSLVVSMTNMDADPAVVHKK